MSLYDKIKKADDEDEEPGAMAKKRAGEKKDYAKIGEMFCELMKEVDKIEGDDDASE